MRDLFTKLEHPTHAWLTSISSCRNPAKTTIYQNARVNLLAPSNERRAESAAVVYRSEGER